jgi:hypothetical protein
MTTDFGNTFVHLRRVSIVGAIFAFVTGILFILVAYAHDRLSTHWVSILVFPLCIGGILPFVVFLTCLFSIRLDERHIAHLFCGRFILSQQPLSELEGIEVGGAFAVVFRFSRGATIRFFGAHMRVVQSIIKRVHELRPDLADARG